MNAYQQHKTPTWPAKLRGVLAPLATAVVAFGAARALLPAREGGLAIVAPPATLPAATAEPPRSSLPPRPGSRAASTLAWHALVPDAFEKRLVSLVNDTSRQGVNYFRTESRDEALALARLFARLHPVRARDFAVALPPGDYSRHEVCGQIFRQLAADDPSFALAALGNVPAAQHASAAGALHEEFATDDALLAQLRPKLTPVERHELEIAPILARAAEPGQGPAALAAAEALTALGQLGAATVRHAALTEWMAAQPAEFVHWLRRSGRTVVSPAQARALSNELDRIRGPSNAADGQKRATSLRAEISATLREVAP